MTDTIRSWPGKSPAGPSAIAHPAVYHLLDAAAVAEILVRRWSLPESLQQAFVLLVALHDLGKVGRPFREMLETGKPQSAGTHWEVTEAYLRAFDGDLCAPALGGDTFARFALYAAASGHHGRPPFKRLEAGPSGAPTRDWKRMIDAAGSQGVTDAREIFQTFVRFWPDASLEGISEAEAQKLSWRLAGLTTASDWIASNVDWFAPEISDLALPSYLASARQRAPAAVQTAGLQAPPISRRELFNFRLRNMQVACDNTDLPEGPMLAIIEDETGSGKTEAALILARRMLKANKALGIYVALPTMATADAMFARIVELLPKIFDSPPSVALAHGRAALSEAWRELQSGETHNPHEPDTQRISDWVADNRRRSLLATIGIGTIDQALLSVLRAKHAPLRQFGLSSKILIIDEVHEMGDPYMGRVLQELLLVHAAHGGSAILLSATIPIKLRQSLVNAFEEGAGRPPPSLQSKAYPALTVPQAPAHPIESLPSARGDVDVYRVDTAEAAVDLLANAVRQGAACVWVRNAVDDAISAVEALRARDVKADLLHARFTLADRKEHEARALALYGKERAPLPGRVLVATQVVESSLDLDFDVMVSDLAPMASLIQRAGRLWRHMDRRPAGDRPVSKPTLNILSPDPAAATSDDWLHETLGSGAFVYDIALQWRTASVLFRTGSIRAPDGLRDLIEAAHGNTISIPDCLAQQDIDATGKAGGQANLASQNVINWAQGYRSGGACDDDADYPTRLGLPQLPLILCRAEGDRLLPWTGTSWTVEACQLSEVQASAGRLGRYVLPEQSDPKIQRVIESLPEWIGRTRYVCPVSAEGLITEDLHYFSHCGLVFAR